MASSVWIRHCWCFYSSMLPLKPSAPCWTKLGSSLMPTLCLWIQLVPALHGLTHQAKHLGFLRTSARHGRVSLTLLVIPLNPCWGYGQNLVAYLHFDRTVVLNCGSAFSHVWCHGGDFTMVLQLGQNDIVMRSAVKLTDRLVLAYFLTDLILQTSSLVWVALGEFGVVLSNQRQWTWVGRLTECFIRLRRWTGGVLQVSPGFVAASLTFLDVIGCLSRLRDAIFIWPTWPEKWRLCFSCCWAGEVKLGWLPHYGGLSRVQRGRSCSLSSNSSASSQWYAEEEGWGIRTARCLFGAHASGNVDESVKRFSFKKP